MDDDIERRKKLIFDRVGAEGLEILRQSGIDIDSAVTEILQEQEDERQKLELQAEFPTVSDMMTSELAYRSGKIEDALGQEYARRLKLIGFDDEQIRSLYDQESLITLGEGLRGHRKQPWVRRYFIMPNSTPENMPKPEELTLSELIIITDDANAAFSRDHHILPDEAWAALCIAACSAPYTEARYAKAFNERVERLGWSKEQGSAYIRNECMLTERLKWGDHNNPAWIEETTDLKQFKR